MSRTSTTHGLLMKVCLAVCLAATLTAEARPPRDYCANIGPYYWEIGNATSVLASGSANCTSTECYDRGSVMSIASASKWLYGAYVAQTKTITPADVSMLQMTAGYVDFAMCTQFQTVGKCAIAGSNDLITPAAIGKFSYGGGHMQMHAATGPLAAMNAAALGAAMSSALGVEVAYQQPQLAGGAVMNAAGYAQFLRRLMTGGLTLPLGAHQICTDPATCPTALKSPTREPWNYSLGHWVELDGTFSSAGAFGFYPWISADKKLYGIVATTSAPSGWASAQCGRQIRNRMPR